MTDAGVYLTSQAHALCDGLRHAHDPTRSAAALATHIAGASRWAVLLASADRDAADELSGLWSLHDRLAAGLGHGLDGWFSAEAAAAVRAAQAERLLASTAAAVDHVGSSDQRRTERSWPAPTGSPTPSTKRSADTRLALNSASA